MTLASRLALALALVASLVFATACNKDKTADKPDAKAPAAEKDAQGGNAAIVNGVAITMDEYNKNFERVQKQLMSMGQNLQGQQMADFKRNSLNNLIERSLLDQEAKKRNLTPDAAEVETQFAAFKSRFPSPDAFKEALAQMGWSEEQGKAQLVRDLTVKKLIDAMLKDAPAITDAEIKAYYDANTDKFAEAEQVKASHILVKVDASADKATKDAAKKKITDLLGKLKKGADFATLAKENSDCPSKAQGGDLGFFGHGQMVKPFEEAAFTLPVGKISDVIETQFGFHIIKVTEKKPAKKQTFEEAKKTIAEQFKQEQMQKVVRENIDKLRAAAKIEILIKDLPPEAPKPAAPAQAPGAAPAPAPAPKP